MNRNIYILTLTFLIIISTNLFAQIHINEIMSSNTNTIYASDGDTPDWIELYNTNDTIVNLNGYGLSDDIEEPFKWVFPDINIPPNEYLLIFASGDDQSIIQHWETVIDWGDDWSYFIGTHEPPTNWKELGFDDSAWPEGPSGFGYGDGDDATIVPAIMSVYVRKSFANESIDNILDIILHVDYDDAFVAYINGTEVARSNIGTVGIPPAFNEGADAWREALIFTGGMPEEFQIDAVLQDGGNILSIQVHNFDQFSSDLSLIPFLTLSMTQVPDNPQGTPDILNYGTSGFLETNFKISSDGEHILLSDPSEFIIDQVDSLMIPEDISYGRQPDGSDTWMFFSAPTPGESNSTQGSNAFCDFPEFSIEGGVYSSAVEVLITTSLTDYPIFYTLDGSDPTINSSIYDSPVVIGQTKVLRAAIISSDCISNEITTKTYLINEESNLPTVSLTTDPYNLFDEEYGIYVLGNNYENWNPFFGANFWEDWERPIHIEFFEPDGTLGFAQDAGVKIFGGWSRAMAQKSLAIFARSEYGNNEINYQIFPDKSIDSFKSIVLRNSGNEWFGFEAQANATMFRDGMHTSLMDNTGIDHQEYRPAVVYLNGEYWGIHNIREKVNEEFLASNNPGVDPDELDELEFGGDIIEGDNQDYLGMIDFVENNDLSNPDNYLIVEEQVDIENFIDYYIIQIYAGNTDWPGNNIKFWRPHIEGAKWKWILYDTDFGFGLFDWWASNVYHNTLLFALDDNGPDWPNPPWSTLLFRSLMENDEFQNKFINHFCYYLSTRFEPSYVENHISDIVDNIAPEMPNHISRWGGNMGTWNQSINFVQEFGALRADIVFNHVGNYFGLNETSNLEISSSPEEGGSLYTSNQGIPENPWEATYFNGIPIEITAVPNPGYIFSHWSGPGIVFEPTIMLTLSGNMDLTAIFVEDSDPPIIAINEFLTDNESIIADETGVYEDWIELYYNTTQTINLEGFSLSDDLNETNMWLFPDIEVIGEGYLLIWADDDVEDGELHTNFQLSGSGEDIGLFDINGNLIDGLSFGEQGEDISYGRIPDGLGEWQSLNYPTPGESNEIFQCSVGDVNCDDVINILDVVQIVSFILGNMEFTLEQEALSDINGDGAVNILDIVQLVYSILDS